MGYARDFSYTQVQGGAQVVITVENGICDADVNAVGASPDIASEQADWESLSADIITNCVGD